MSKTQLIFRPDSEKHGEVWVWLCGLAVTACVFMLSGLLGLILYYGGSAFWPRAIFKATLADHSEVWGHVLSKRVVKTTKVDQPQEEWFWFVGNNVFASGRYRFINKEQFSEVVLAKDVWVLEPIQGGRIFAVLESFEMEESTIPVMITEKSFEKFLSVWRRVRKCYQQAERLENVDLRGLVYNLERKKRQGNKERIAALEQQIQCLLTQIQELHSQARTAKLNLRLANSQRMQIPLCDVVEMVNPEKLSALGKFILYLQRWWRFLSTWPRVANTEGGIFPAIFGTFVMTVLMSGAVVPLGVLVAIYLREYARSGPVLSVVRICVNNLAGVPSIVYGVFGLGFFVYIVGGTIDDLFYQSRKPVPVLGTGGILWASLTLALLTLPVMIVATEEALGAVSRSVREAALACGSTKWQMVWYVLLPAALPGILTGMILAIARGAGEVAPLMITGVVKLAPALPIDSVFPYLHLDRKFMHLGFHIYDLGFQSPDSDAARPLAFASTLVLIMVVGLMNLGAVLLREKIRHKLHTSGL